MASPGVSPEVEAFREAPDRAGVFTDFDGTLSPIVDVPAEARPVAGAVEVLEALARRYRRVGVVSGRPVEFLRTHLGGHGLFLSGLYGLETVEDGTEGQGEVTVAEEAEPWRQVVEELLARAEREAPSPLSVEGKGLSLTVHFRGHPEAESVAREWAEAEAERTGLALHGGRMSFELRPPVERDKGTALAEAAEGLSPVCFLGDDRGDLAAFEALDRLAEQGSRTLRVGVRSEEAPEELLERADLVVDGPEGAVALLRRLAD